MFGRLRVVARSRTTTESLWRPAFRPTSESACEPPRFVTRFGLNTVSSGACRYGHPHAVRLPAVNEAVADEAIAAAPPGLGERDVEGAAGGHAAWPGPRARRS